MLRCMYVYYISWQREYGAISSSISNSHFLSLTQHVLYMYTNIDNIYCTLSLGIFFLPHESHLIGILGHSALCVWQKMEMKSFLF